MRARQTLTLILCTANSLIRVQPPSDAEAMHLEEGLAREAPTATDLRCPHEGQAVSTHDGHQVLPYKCSCWTHHKSQPDVHSGVVHPIQKEESTPPAHLQSAASQCKASKRKHGTASLRLQALRAQHTSAPPPRCRGITIIIGVQALGRRLGWYARSRQRLVRHTCAQTPLRPLYIPRGLPVRHLFTSYRRARDPARDRHTDSDIGA